MQKSRQCFIFSHIVSLWELLSKGGMLKWRNIRLIGRGKEMSWEVGASDVSERTRNLIRGGQNWNGKKI